MLSREDEQIIEKIIELSKEFCKEHNNNCEGPYLNMSMCFLQFLEK